MLTPEQACLLDLARTTWMRRGAAKRARLAYNEETITETMLLELKLRYPGDVTIVPFSKAEEARYGADWGWAFVSADGAWSATMLVQAKRLDNRERNYSGITRTIGQRTPPARQFDQLVATARTHGIPPVYAFYNHLSDEARVRPGCGSMPPGTAEQLEAWGISLASAHAVGRCLPDESFDTHRGHSIALHCMLCSYGTGVWGPRGSPEAAARMLERFEGGGPETPTGEPERGAFREGLHPIIAEASELAFHDDEDGRSAARDRLAERFPGVAGAVILRDSDKGRHE